MLPVLLLHVIMSGQILSLSFILKGQQSPWTGSAQKF